MKNINIPWKGILIVLAAWVFAYYQPDVPRFVGGAFDDLFRTVMAKV